MDFSHKEPKRSEKQLENVSWQAIRLAEVRLEHRDPGTRQARLVNSAWQWAQVLSSHLNKLKQVTQVA